MILYFSTSIGINHLPHILIYCVFIIVLDADTYFNTSYWILLFIYHSLTKHLVGVGCSYCSLNLEEK